MTTGTRITGTIIIGMTATGTMNGEGAAPPLRGQGCFSLPSFLLPFFPEKGAGPGYSDAVRGIAERCEGSLKNLWEAFAWSFGKCLDAGESAVPLPLAGYGLHGMKSNRGRKSAWG